MSPDSQEKNLHELWALLNFLMPEVFGSQETFDQLFNLEETASVAAKERMIKQLHQLLTPFMLRRLKSDVETTLPVGSESVWDAAEIGDDSVRGHVASAEGAVQARADERLRRSEGEREVSRSWWRRGASGRI